MPDLALEAEAFQAMIELRRTAREYDAPDEELALINEDVERAEGVMINAWMEATVGL